MYQTDDSLVSKQNKQTRIICLSYQQSKLKEKLKNLQYFITNLGFYRPKNNAMIINTMIQGFYSSVFHLREMPK
ncbi:unnamed protein product [Rotaria sp. Silwood2]|nr:unnamed protein product [Rotaria sp. Silwood2]CAF4319853.1 unnamed protein product [Rotaria sp. Silwood2]